MARPLGSAPAIGATWESLQPPLQPWILDVVRNMGFTRTTPVQAGTIPRSMKNQDCVVEAVTGSGKTLSYVIPILERICRREEKYKKGQVAALVIAPTRELAQQIHEVFTLFISTLHRVQTEETDGPVASSSRSPSPPTQPPVDPAIPLPLLVTSGTPTPYETFLSQASNIIVGTPGRLASFLLSPKGIQIVKVADFDVLVLDEADRLLSAPDHRKDVERIMRHLPKQRRTHLFSATMTDAVEEMVGLGLRNPVRIVVNLKDKRKGEEPQERRTPTGLQNTYLTCRHAEKTLQLMRLLRRESKINEAAKFIVYFSTCAAVDYFYRVLNNNSAMSGFHLTSFHGDLPPRIRQTALMTFTSHPSSHLEPAVLLCTDVAARGVDFDDVDVVIQYDPPTDPKTFSHRAGRTARAGRKGKSIVLLGKGREEDYVDFMTVRKLPLTRQPYLDAGLEEVDAPESLDPAALDLMTEIRRLVKTDRELVDKGAKAFVSALRAYTKHEASYIFRIVDIDFNAMAIAYGLLRLPAMPEVRDWKKRRDARLKRIAKAREEGKDVEDDVEEMPWEEEMVDWDNFAYGSKAKEAARLAELQTKKEKRSTENTSEEMKKKKIRAEMREAWSEKKERKAKKEERREKKDKRKDAEWALELEAAEKEGDIGPIEALRREKAARAAAAAEGKKAKATVDGDEDGEEGGFDHEYKVLKKEVREERAAKRLKKGDQGGGLSGGMFDGLE